MPIGETPFHLAFRSEVVIPAEVRLVSYKIAYYDEERNKEEIRLHLDMLDEVRAKTEQWLAHYQDLMAKHIIQRLRPNTLA